LAHRGGWIFALLLIALWGWTANAGSGTFTITSITDNGDGSYTLTVSSSAGMTAGDHLGGKLSSGRGGIYEVISTPTGTSVIVSDTKTEQEGGAFGVPAAGDGWYATPTTNLGLSLPPYTAKGWDAALRRNAHMIDVDSFFGLAKTDGNFVVGDGTGWVAESGATARASLGVTIGTDVQAWDAQLDDLAGLTVTKGNVVVADGANWSAFGVGADGFAIVASSAATVGVVWSRSRTHYMHAQQTEVAATSANYSTIASVATFTIGPNTITDDGDTLLAEAGGDFETNSGQFQIQVLISDSSGAPLDGAALTINPGGGTGNFFVKIRFVRTSLTNVMNSGFSMAKAGSVDYMVPHYGDAATTNFSAQLNITVRFQVAGAGDVLTLGRFTVRKIEAP